jgi:tRNA pseudouridine55 synthase
MLSGILVVNKEAGKTSNQIVGTVRKLTGFKKIGHAGTLDPDVTGVLPLCLGSATRLIEYIQEQQKSYRAEVTFGFSTTTQDASGETVAVGNTDHITEQLVKASLEKFRGNGVQTPPAYSALKVNGKRAYELARAGESVELQPRPITIYDIELLSFVRGEKTATAEFDVTCSKGTYVRTLCHDLGDVVGCPAHMSRLVRTRSGPFTIEDAKTLSEIESAIRSNQFATILLPPVTALLHVTSWTVDEELTRRIRSGQSISLRPLHLQDHWQAGTRLRVMSEQQELLAIYEVVRNEHGIDVAKPVKVFS